MNPCDHNRGFSAFIPATKEVEKMSSIWRVLFFVYNLVVLVLAGAALASAAGRPEPMKYIIIALSTPGNRLVLGIVAVLFIVVTVMVLFYLLKGERQPRSIVVEHDLTGEISITVPAIKAIIMKAVKPVEGLREIRPVVNNSPQGLVIYLHTAVNPSVSVPDMGREIQALVKKSLQEIGGLQVAEVRVLADDLSQSHKPTGR